MTNDVFKSVYQIVCTSVTSKPDVSLSLYDTNTVSSISNSQNSIISNSCDSNNLCTNILQVNFQFLDNSFNEMTSLSCSANSKNVLIPLTQTISRNVNVQVIGKMLKNYI